MKKTIDFIISFWKPILFVVVFTIIFSYIGISNCREKKSIANQEQINISDLRAFLVDSMQTVNLNGDIAKLDSVKAAEADKTTFYKESARYWENIAISKGKSADKFRNKADSLAKLDTGQCAEIIQAFRQSNDTLKSQNMALDSANVKF